MSHWTDDIGEECRQIDEGQSLLVTDGEYSDYGVNALIRAIKGFDWCVVVKAWERECKPYGDDPDEIERRYVSYLYNESPSFIAYLIKGGFVEDLRYREFHGGSYGRFEPTLEPATPSQKDA